jgi:hypothetical protein
MLTHLRTAAMMLLLLTALTGLVYPVVVTGLAQLVFPHQANGSLIMKDGKPIGSELIGQPFDDPKYFWSGHRRGPSIQRRRRRLAPGPQPGLPAVADRRRVERPILGTQGLCRSTWSQPPSGHRISHQPLPSTRSPELLRRAACPRAPDNSSRTARASAVRPQRTSRQRAG